jgi:predicted ATPase
VLRNERIEPLLDETAMKTINIFSEKFYYLSAERVGPRVSYDIQKNEVEEKKQLGNRGELVSYYLYHFQGEEIPIKALVHPNFTESNTLLYQVQAWLNKIRPNIKIHLHYNQQQKTSTIKYSFHNGQDIGQEFLSTNVGFGITFVLSIIVAILSSEPGSILLIENPEAHLHPGGQSQIAELISLAAANGIQIICETHSDHIINGVMVQNKKFDTVKIGIYYQDTTIYFFDQENGKSIVTKIPIEKGGRIKRMPNNFFDQMDIDLEYLMSR